MSLYRSYSEYLNFGFWCYGFAISSKSEITVIVSYSHVCSLYGRIFCNNTFDPNWILPCSRLLDNAGRPRTCYRRSYKSHTCILCGWFIQEGHLVYPLAPFRSPAENLYQPFAHFPCFTSSMHDYPHSRFQAVLAITRPQQVIWAVSQNVGWQMGNHNSVNYERWTLVEVLDLIVGMKLAGFLPVHPHGPYPMAFPNDKFDWNRILRFCPILRKTGKSVKPNNQLQKKWQLECKHVHLYFTPQFFAQHIPRIQNSNLPPL